MRGDSDSVVEIPPERLPAETLRALIEEFVTRDGTDYGRSEKSTDQKVEDVRRQLVRREVIIVFDPETQTANIVRRPP